jgi:uncharacterized protein YggL (DUF469 family)
MKNRPDSSAETIEDSRNAFIQLLIHNNELAYEIIEKERLAVEKILKKREDSMEKSRDIKEQQEEIKRSLLLAQQQVEVLNDNLASQKSLEEQEATNRLNID